MATRDPDVVMQEIVEGAARLMPAADTAVLFLYDHEHRKLRPAWVRGIGSSAYDLSFDPGEGVSGRTFQTGHGEIFNERRTLYRLARTRGENRDLFNQAVAGIGQTRAGISAALRHQGKVFGAIVALALRPGPPFDRQDLGFLEAMAEVAAAALTFARAAGAEQAERVRQEAAYRALDAERQELERRIAGVHSLIEVLTEGLTLPALAARLAEQASSQVLVADLAFGLRASSPPVDAATLRDLLAEHWSRMRAVLDDVVRRRARQRAVLSDGRQVMAVPVVARGKVVGHLLFIAEGGPVPSRADLVAEVGAALCATEMLQERAFEEGDIWEAWNVIDLLAGSDASTARGAMVGIAVGAVVDRASERSMELHALEVLKKLVQGRLRRARCSAAVAVRDRNLVVVWPKGADDEHDAPAPLREQLRGAAAEIQALNPGWAATFAIGRADALGSLGRAYHEAQLALAVGTRFDDEPIFNVSSLGAQRLIIRAASTAESVELCESVLGRVVSHDRLRGAQLLSTFRAYIRSGWSVTETARALHVHTHTVHYRLRRLQELSGLDLRDSDDRLTLELAMRIRDLARPDSLSE
jgi:sugar diacid utilization regulator